MNQLLNTVDVLIEIGDDTENWDERKKWINSVLNELWKARGPYRICIRNGKYGTGGIGTVLYFHYR